MIEKLHQQIAKGRFASEDDAVHASLLNSFANDDPSLSLEPWMIDDLHDTARRIDSGEEETFSLDEVEEALEQARTIRV